MTICGTTWCSTLSQAVQRELHYAIIDEIDNILIDEARTPLIISGPADEASPYYAKFAQLVRILKPSSEESIEAEDPDGDYVYELRTRNVYLTEQGIVKIQNSLGVENLYDAQNAEVLPYLDNALRAHVVFKLDKDYVVQNGEIIIVDDFTGRLMYGRRYSEGLHQAIEAKEGVSVRRENLTHATVTYQNFFRMYGKLAGMTGTAATEGEEFEEIYSLDVTILPTNIEYRAQIGELEAERGKDAGAEVVTYHGPNGEEFYKRVDYPDIVFGTEAIKFAKAADEIEAMHKAGRPVLVGTAAIETSEHLAKLLERRNIPHQVLNAKYHEREAIIIAQAGRPGAVTIATNMAGRGVDILLGGNSEGLARDILRKQGIEITEATPEQWQEALVTAEAECKANRDHVWQQGGLHVIGTERHDARRIDNQLRGRAGRQGDPGSSRFYLSMEDELFRRFGGDRLKGFLKANMGDEPIALGLISKSIEQSQTRVEGYNFDIRKRVLEYDEVVNEQRRVIYEQRRRVLEQDDLRDILLEMAEGEINDLVRAHTQGFEDDWDLEHLEHEVRTWFALPAGVGVESWSKLTPEEIAAELRLEAAAAYDQARERAGLDAVRAMAKSNLRLDQLASMESPPGVYSFLKVLLRQQLPSSLWTQIEVGPVANLSRDEKEQIQQVCSRVLTYQRDKSIMLRTVDSLWVRHLTDLDILREGIGLRAVAQQDPLVAFKKDAHEMYGALLSQIRTEIVALMFQPVPTGALSIAAPRRQLYTNRGGDSDGRQRPVRQAKDTVGRNDPCPCGSGKKYKHCCMKKDRDAASGAHPAGSAQAAAGAVRKRRKRRR